MNLGKLKEILQTKMELVEMAIERYGDLHEVELKQNTYWCSGDFLSVPSKGFVDFESLVEEDEDDY